jgi:diketogulonate reductase-like aldo/keto reductase
LLKDEVINKLAQKYNKSAGQICLRWNTQRNVVVIPKSVTPSRIKENISVCDFFFCFVKKFKLFLYD